MIEIGLVCCFLEPTDDKRILSSPVNCLVQCIINVNGGLNKSLILLSIQNIRQNASALKYHNSILYSCTHYIYFKSRTAPFILHRAGAFNFSLRWTNLINCLMASYFASYSGKYLDQGFCRYRERATFACNMLWYQIAVLMAREYWKYFQRSSIFI